MPYATIADLPDAVKERYSARCQEVFRKAFNAHEGSEESRFRVAHTAAGNCKEAGKAVLSTETRAGKALMAMKATLIDDDAFRLLAIPFGGPIPSRVSPLGVDLDGEWFSHRTDIKPEWFDVRLVDWHHGRDATLGRMILGKATDLTEEEDGWWVRVWLRHGERRIDLIRKLAEKGAQLFGSSESVAGLTKKTDAGEYLAWPYVRQTLSTSPQNTWSILRPLKATLDDYTAEGTVPTAAFFSDLTRYLDDLIAGPSANLAGEAEAKAGRVLAARNEARIREAIDDLEQGDWNPVIRRAALQKFAEVLAELDRYVESKEILT